MTNINDNNDYIKYAIDKDTGRISFAEFTERNCKNTGSRHWVCPICNNAVGIKKGEKKIHHFYHLSNKQVNDCTFYDISKSKSISNETKKKYDDKCSRFAANFLKELLSNSLYNIKFEERCDGKQGCPSVYYIDSSSNKLKTEYILESVWQNNLGKKMRFDLARYDFGELTSVYEIIHTHATNESNRLNLPCEWFQFSAKQLLTLKAQIDCGLKTDNNITLTSQRNIWRCSRCEYEELQKLVKCSICYKQTSLNKFNIRLNACTNCVNKRSCIYCDVFFNIEFYHCKNCND